MGWFEDRWHDLTGLGWGTWLAIALWLALALGLAALIFTHFQLKRSRELKREQTRPQVAMFMEPHSSDWHVIELVVRNFGKTAAYEVQFVFDNPPTVGQYENEHDGMVNVAELALPSTIPALAPGQEWRTVWDSALSRAELGGSIEWRFTGTVKYFDEPATTGKRLRKGEQRHQFQTQVVLDWDDLQPVQRVELMTSHDLAKRERNKLELLRNLLTYFHYASQETRTEAFKSEIDGVRRATEAVKERIRARQLDDPTDVRMRPLDQEAQYQTEDASGRHRNGDD